MTEQVIENAESKPRTVYHTVDQAVEAMKDIEAGIEPTQHEPEQRPHYANEDEALAAITEREKAEAEVTEYNKTIAQNTQNQQLADDSFELSGNHAQQITLYKQAYQEFAAECGAFDKAVRSIDMNKLRKENPAEWSALQTEIREYKAKLGKNYNQLLNAAGAIQTNIGNGVLEKERRKLLKAAPELANEKVQADVRRYLLNNGMTQAEIEDAVDHRFVLNAYKAMQHEQAEKSRNKIPKRLKKQAKKVFNSKVETAKKQFYATRSMTDLFAWEDAKAEAAQQKSAPSTNKSSSPIVGVSSKISELRAEIARNPNSNRAAEAAAEILGLQRRLANA